MLAEWNAKLLQFIRCVCQSSCVTCGLQGSYSCLLFSHKCTQEFIYFFAATEVIPAILAWQQCTKIGSIFVVFFQVLCECLELSLITCRTKAPWYQLKCTVAGYYGSHGEAYSSSMAPGQMVRATALVHTVRCIMSAAQSLMVYLSVTQCISAVNHCKLIHEPAEPICGHFRSYVLLHGLLLLSGTGIQGVWGCEVVGGDMLERL